MYFSKLKSYLGEHRRAPFIDRMGYSTRVITVPGTLAAYSKSQGMVNVLKSPSTFRMFKGEMSVGTVRRIVTSATYKEEL
jgi:hypothetical protein